MFTRSPLLVIAAGAALAELVSVVLCSAGVA